MGKIIIILFVFIIIFIFFIIFDFKIKNNVKHDDLFYHTNKNDEELKKEWRYLLKNQFNNPYWNEKNNF